MIDKFDVWERVETRNALDISYIGTYNNDLVIEFGWEFKKVYYDAADQFEELMNSANKARYYQEHIEEEYDSDILPDED